MNRTSRGSIVLLGVVIASLTCVGAGPYVVSWGPLAGRPECPHDWDLKKGQAEVVTRKIDIPEFNDCQRFLRDRSGQLEYGALYAIFAADSMFLPIGQSIPLAEIYAEGWYGALGIRPGYNCLFMARDSSGAFGARMVSVSNADINCRLLNPDTLPGTQLRVHVNQAKMDAPPAARWEWDDRIRQQFIGIECGGGVVGDTVTTWCEVGSAEHERAGFPQSGFPPGVDGPQEAPPNPRGTRLVRYAVPGISCRRADTAQPLVGSDLSRLDARRPREYQRVRWLVGQSGPHRH